MGVWSIKARLIKSTLGLVALLWISGMLIAGAVVRHEITEVFDSALRETADHLVPIVLDVRRWKTDRQAPTDEDHMATYAANRGHVHYVVRDRAGAVVMASKGAPMRPDSIPLKRGFHTLGETRYFARFLEDEGLWIIVVQELRERYEAANGLWMGLASPLLALLPIAAFGIWRSVGRVTEPISAMARELEARGGSDLTAIDATGLPAELAPIGVSVNKLLQRLKAALDAERAFSANAAHELRNPIAGARAQLELLAGNLRGTAENERVEDIASQLDRLGRRVEKLLQISRAEAGAAQSGDRADLATVAALICDEFRQQAHVGSRLALDVDDDTSFWVAMDMDALAIVLRNAIENAVTHGAPTEPIMVRIDPDRSLHVINGCRVVSPAALERLTSRFHRGRERPPPGSGLGLTIIETIMRQAGGTMELRSPAAGSTSGFEVVLRFPDPPEKVRHSA